MPEQIKLTPEQERLIPQYVERFRAIGLSTKPTDKDKAEKALVAIYHHLQWKTPEIIWVDSPIQGAIKAAQLAKGSEDVTDQEIQDQASKASYGQAEAYWVSVPAFATEVLGIEDDGLTAIVQQITEEVSVFWTFEDVIVVSIKPTKISMKDEKLHCEDDLAIEYPDGWGVYAVNGKVYDSMMAARIALHETE